MFSRRCVWFFGNLDNPSVVCDKDATPNCCENEDYNLIGTICYDGLGRYRDEGEYYCAEDKLDGEILCNAEAIESPLNYEICDSLDDNCNGQIDEGFSIDEECTGDNGIGGIKCLGDNDTYCEIVSTFTPTFTLTNKCIFFLSSLNKINRNIS